jgi:NADH pyrophosphatase NudC (nudix superfamily)
MQFCPKCGNPLVASQMDGKERLVCSATCGYVFWDNPVPVVAAIVELDGSVILVRNKTWPEKFLGLVTGFLEKGETPEQAIHREVKEELGLEGGIAGFVGYYSFFQMNQIILTFHVRATGAVTLGDEIAEYKLLSPDRVRPWNFGTGLAVRDWLEKRKK